MSTWPLFKRHEKRWLLTLLALCLALPAMLWLRQRGPAPLFSFQPAPGVGPGRAAFASSIVYSPDGKTLACAFAVEQGRKVVGGKLQLWTPAEIRLYNSENGVCRQTIRLGSGTVDDLTFTADGHILRGNCQDGFTRWWNLASGSVVRKVWQGKFWMLATSRDGRWQLAQCEPKVTKAPFNYTILLRDNNTGKVRHKFIIGERPAMAAAFTDDGSRFVLIGDVETLNYDYVASFYRTSDATILSTQNWGRAGAYWMKFVTNSQIVGVTGSPFVWRGGPQPQTLNPIPGDFRAGAVSADGQWLAAGGGTADRPWRSRFVIDYQSEGDPNANFGHAGIWNLADGQCLWHIRTGGTIVNEIALAPNKLQMAVTVSDSMFYANEPRSHVEVWPLPSGLRRSLLPQ